MRGSAGTRTLFSIVIVLALLAIPFMYASQKQLHASYRKRAAADIRTLMGALDDFASGNVQAYPRDLDAWFAKEALNSPYLVRYHGRMPRDGWGHPFVYEPPTEVRPRARIVSYGADGVRGGTGSDADIDSEALPRAP
ncbi:MAG TPA: type II secretion system protein GspG [Myxococcota bacterium]|nr:type II secretion system protein GspG [Myxococcota bacterium]